MSNGRLRHPAASKFYALTRQPSRTQRATRSVVSAANSTSDTRHYLFDTDPGCLITNIQRHTDQVCHWINAQRKDPKLKQKVEAAIVGFGITIDEFDLNHESNLCFLDSSLHLALDKYEFIAFTVSLETGKKFLQYLEDDLAKRQSTMDRYDQHQSRVFDPNVIEGAEFQLVLLHPYQLLPEQLPLHRKGYDGTWESYIVTNDGLLRATLNPADTDAEEFPKVTFESTREPKEILNPWFVILNAGIKFDRFRDNYGLDTLPSSMAEIAQQTLEIVDLIYKPIVPSAGYIKARESPKKRAAIHSEEGGVGIGRQLRSTKGKDTDRAGDLGEQDASGSPTRYNFDDLSLEQRRALGNYIFSSASGFRQTDSDEELGEDEESVDTVHLDTQELLAEDAEYENQYVLRQSASIVV